MTVATGSLIVASDITSFTGNVPSNKPYSNDVAATNKLYALWGIGYGTRGYGQTYPILSTVDPGQQITADKWITFSSVIHSLANHMGVTISNIPSSSDFVVGQPILPISFDYNSAITTLDSNRLNYDPTTMTSNIILTSNRTASWDTKIYLEAIVDFFNEDTARFFFNSGGQIQLNAAWTPSGSDARSISWQTLLATIGQINIGYNYSSISGSGGTLSSGIGYYSLTDRYSQIYICNSNSPFSNNYTKVSAKRINYKNINGGNGSGISIIFEFDDFYIGPIDGSMNVTVSSYSPSSVLSIGNPVANKITGVDGGGALNVFLFNDIVSTNINNYDLLSRATAAGYNNIIPLYATVTVQSGVVIGSASTTQTAFVVDSLPTNSQIVITNYGIIAGAGGNGGDAAPAGGYSGCGCPPGGNGANGGTAVVLNYPTQLLNYGIIGGGGGGGGGGGAECAYNGGHGWNSSAGSGGGGAGSVGGNGGARNYCGVTGGRVGGAGYPGTVTNGGAGGYPGNGHPYTAQGGNGGDLGANGQAGESKNAAGGSGGIAGNAINGNINILSGSVLGNIYGNIS